MDLGSVLLIGETTLQHDSETLAIRRRLTPVAMTKEIDESDNPLSYLLFSILNGDLCGLDVDSIDPERDHAQKTP